MTFDDWRGAAIRAPGTEETQFIRKGLFELGIRADFSPPPPLTWLRAEAAQAGEENAKKQ